jgi:hypothetical protein
MSMENWNSQLSDTWYLFCVHACRLWAWVAQSEGAGLDDRWSILDSGRIIFSPRQALSLCFNWAPGHEGVLGKWRYSSTHPLTSALDGGEWSASRPCYFTPRKRAPGTHWIGGWMGPRAVLDAVMKRKIPRPRRESNPRTPNVQPVTQR